MKILTKKREKRIYILGWLLIALLFLTACGNDDVGQVSYYTATVKVVDEQGEIISTANAEIENAKTSEGQNGVFKFLLEGDNKYKVKVTDSSGKYEEIEKDFTLAFRNTTVSIPLEKEVLGTAVQTVDSEGDFAEITSLKIEGVEGEKVNNYTKSYELKKGQEYKITVEDDNNYFKSKTKTIKYEGEETLKIPLERKIYTATIEVININDVNIEGSIITNEQFEKIENGIFTADLKAGKEYNLKIEDQNKIYSSTNVAIEMTNKNYSKKIPLYESRKFITVNGNITSYDDYDSTTVEIDIENAIEKEKVGHLTYNFLVEIGEDYTIKTSDSSKLLAPSEKQITIGNQDSYSIGIDDAIEITSFNIPYQINNGETVNIDMNAQFSAYIDGEMTVNWTSTNGTIDGDLHGATYTAPDNVMTDEVSVEIKLGEYVETQTRTINIYNSAPFINGIDIPNNIKKGESVEITAEVSDPEGDEITYTWTAENGSISGSDSKITYTAPDIIWEELVEWTVTDDKENSMTSGSYTNINYLKGEELEKIMELDNNYKVINKNLIVTSLDLFTVKNVSNEIILDSNKTLNYDWNYNFSNDFSKVAYNANDGEFIIYDLNTKSVLYKPTFSMEHKKFEISNDGELLFTDTGEIYSTSDSNLIIQIDNFTESDKLIYFNQNKILLSKSGSEINTYDVSDINNPLKSNNLTHSGKIDFLNPNEMILFDSGYLEIYDINTLSLTEENTAEIYGIKKYNLTTDLKYTVNSISDKELDVGKKENNNYIKVQSLSFNKEVKESWFNKDNESQAYIIKEIDSTTNELLLIE